MFSFEHFILNVQPKISIRAFKLELWFFIKIFVWWICEIESMIHWHLKPETFSFYLLVYHGTKLIFYFQWKHYSSLVTTVCCASINKKTPSAQIQQLHRQIFIITTGIHMTCNVFINVANVFYFNEMRRAIFLSYYPFTHKQLPGDMVIRKVILQFRQKACIE